MSYEPGLKEDAKNLSVITGAAAFAALVTLALIAGSSNAAPERAVRVIPPPPPEAPAPPEPMAPVEPGTPLTGIDRLYGTVTTAYGDRITGYLRWDRNEGSWTDLLDATKPRPRGGSTISGIRFGHVDRLDVAGRNGAVLTLRSGAQVALGSNATDLGSGLRAVTVSDPQGGEVALEWSDMASVDFQPAPSTPPAEERLHGTVTTASGETFTGYVTWDVDEIYSTDILDGDADGERMEIPFGEIASIERYASWGSLVTLHGGEEHVLRGTNDVDASIRGIEVSDPTLGAVKLQWGSFDHVRFHEPGTDVAAARLDGGGSLHGIVRTVDGSIHTGDIVWDDDERFTWEMLNGDAYGVEYHVELGQVERIERSGNGSLVTLRDGRSLHLSGSNDVDHGNRGITVRTDGREFEVQWDDFAEVTFTR